MMSDEKSKRALKLKTLDEIHNDAVYEINLFSKKRRSPLNNKPSITTTTAAAAANEEEFADEQVRDEIFIQSFCFDFFRITIIVWIFSGNYRFG